MNFNFENIQLEKNMYYNSKKNFSQILEELDPSENYSNSKFKSLDAYQRQLKRFGIKINGKNCNYAGSFFENSASSILFPEFVARSVEQGMRENSILNDIVATTNKINTLTYQNLQLTKFEPKLDKNIKETEDMPETQLKINKNFIELKKYGHMLTASYETIEFQKIDSLQIILKQMGRDLSDAIAKDAIEVLINGNNQKENKDAAEVVNVQKEGELKFEDLVNVWLKFKKCNMTTVLINPVLLAKIATMNEFKNPNSSINFQNKGELITLFGAKVIKTCAAPEDAIICLDKEKALTRLIAKEITPDADRLIEKQITRSVIYTITGFVKIFKDASFVLKLKK